MSSYTTTEDEDNFIYTYAHIENTNRFNITQHVIALMDTLTVRSTKTT